MSRQSLNTASLLVVAAALVGKVVGLLREIIVARAFGTGAEFDAFLAAITIPAAIHTVVTYALPNLLVPVYAGGGGSRHRLPIGFWLGLLLPAAALTAGMAIFAPEVISLIVPGLSDILAVKAALMLRAYSIVVLLAVISASGTARLQGRKFFVRPAIGPALLNILVMASVYIFAERIGAYSIIWSTLAGTLVLGVWYWWPVREERVLEPPGAGRFDPLESLGKIAIGVMVAAVLGQLFFAVDRWWASYLLPGSISALRYATTVSNLPVFIVGTGLAVAIFPFLNEALSSGKTREGPLILDRAVRYLVWAGLPLVVIIGLYGDALVGLFLQRGKFDAESTALTIRLLPYLAFGLIPYASIPLWEKVYYSQRRLLLLIGIVSAAFACKFGLSWILVAPLEIDGLALATAISYVCWGALMFFGIHKSVRPAFLPLLGYFLKIAILTLGGGLLGFYISGQIIPGLGDSVFWGRAVRLAFGLVFVWGPLLLIDGRWGIRERKQVWETITKAIGLKMLNRQ